MNRTKTMKLQAIYLWPRGLITSSIFHFIILNFLCILRHDKKFKNFLQEANKFPSM